MKIRFEETGFSLFPNFKGGEKELSANMFYDGTNRIFKGRLTPGASIGLHTHEDSCEVIFILEGNGTLTETAPEGDMTPGSGCMPASSDAEKEDAGKEDAEKVDAGKEDAGKEDAGKEDAGKEDAGKEGAKKEATSTIQPVSPGDCLYCPKGHAHSLKNTDQSQDLVFYAVVAMQ